MNIGKKNIDIKSAKELFYVFLNLIIESHNFSKRFNDELEALYLLDEEIRNKRNELISFTNSNSLKFLKEMDIPFKSDNDATVFLHFAGMILEDICHKVVYELQTDNKELYIEKAIDMIYALFISTTEYQCID